MGHYASNLSKRLRGPQPQDRPKAADPSIERLIGVAIERDGEVCGASANGGFKSHWQLRAALNPEHHDHRFGLPGDVDGFLTSAGRFVSRREAEPIAVAAGQLSGPLGRELLSSDLHW